jgi:hypothetical protein
LLNSFKYRGLVHVAGWVIFFIIPLLLFPTHEFSRVLSDPSNVLSLFIRNILWMGLFYLNLLYFTPSLLQKKEVLVFLVSTLAAIMVVTLINSGVHHFFSQLLNPNPGFRPPPDFQEPGPGSIPPEGFDQDHGFAPRQDRPRPIGFGPAGPFFINLLISLMIASVSTSMVLWEDWVKTRAEDQERVFQKVTSELAVLKLQISPHFLFNTLNNIRWLIRSGSDQAEASVLKLSHLLRYVLYQTELEKVALEKETEHLQDYIALQKMRLANGGSLLFTMEGIESGQMIVPLLLIPLVENVFKYGEFSEGFQNKIILNVERNVLKFSTVNKITDGSQEKSGKEYGIGLHNVRRRLALHYPTRHVLQFSETDGVFKLELEVILN